MLPVRLPASEGAGRLLCLRVHQRAVPSRRDGGLTPRLSAPDPAQPRSARCAPGIANATNAKVLLTFGRYVPGLRFVVNATMGLSALPYREFLPWSALGGVLWSSYTCLLAYWIGSTLEDFPLASVVISGVVTTAIMGLVFVRERHRRRAGAPPKDTPAGAPSGIARDACATSGGRRAPLPPVPPGGRLRCITIGASRCCIAVSGILYFAVSADVADYRPRSADEHIAGKHKDGERMKGQR
jgi:hypothetical protein